jgi:anti-sigma factor RsiW
MSHLDEGTLHALLDGELETNEVAEIQAHLGACSACGLRLREVKEFLAESDRLIASVDLGEVSVPEPRAAAPATPAAAASAPRPRPVATTPATEPWNEPPPLLLPDNETAADRRARRLRRLNQAAMLAVVVGLGLVWNNLYRGKSAPAPAMDDSVAPQPTAVVSEAESAHPTPPPDTASAKVAVRAPAPAPRAPAPQPAMTRQVAERDDLQSVDSAAESTRDTGNAGGGDSAAVEDIATVRERASEALAQLDRDRRRTQAAAATAALDADKRRRAAATPATVPARTEAAAPAAAPAPPPPPTAEQRAGVYLRIGLDEASRQLGAPAHVIEGMVPLFMGLAQGSTVPGADSTRPVVRVVYQDPQGRLILLDQQRIRQGQTGLRTSALAWTQGEHALWLHGEPNTDVLRTYRPRVR